MNNGIWLNILLVGSQRSEQHKKPRAIFCLKDGRFWPFRITKKHLLCKNENSRTIFVFKHSPNMAFIAVIS